MAGGYGPTSLRAGRARTVTNLTIDDAVLYLRPTSSASRMRSQDREHSGERGRPLGTVARADA
jgi:hypothetical protein